MSAGRLQLYDKLAGPRDRTSRLLVRIEPADGDGPARAAPARVRLQAGRVGEAARDAGARRRRGARQARAGGVAGPGQRARSSRELLDAPRPLHTLLRDQRTIAGIGRSWVDEILWDGAAVALQARRGPRRRGGRDGCARRSSTHARRRARPLRAGRRAADPRQAADAAEGPPPRGRAVPALRRDAARPCTSRTTSSRTARASRPRAGCSRTGGCRGC